MREVIIESRPAIEVVEAYDHETTLHYLDPPYVLGSRSTSNRHGYQHEMTDNDHRQLLDRLTRVAGMVVLSGYSDPIYDRFLAEHGWECHRLEVRTAGRESAVESLWKNPAAVEAHHQQSMFSNEEEV